MYQRADDTHVTKPGFEIPLMQSSKQSMEGVPGLVLKPVEAAAIRMSTRKFCLDAVKRSC